MSNDVLVYVEHLEGAVTDSTFELLALGRGLASVKGGELVAALVGSGVESLAGELGAADRILVVDDERLAIFDPQGNARVLTTLVRDREPAMVLVPYTSQGMDLAADVAVGADLPLVSFCRAVRADGELGATVQLYGGKVEADVVVDADRAVFAVLSGAASAEDGRSGGAGNVEQVAVDVGDLAIRAAGVTLPEAGDVDIATQEVLVAVGRGIESEDNIEEVQELADALGAAVAASRPIVDQGWLPKTRQVGKSGLKVKPKVYLALGISGAPEHVEGMRDAATIIAVNTDPQAPIFGVAHYGWVGDLFDLVPELVDRVEGE